VSIQIAEITDADGRVTAPHQLDAALPVHRQLRPQLPQAYAGLMAQVFAGGGRMIVALDQDRVVGVAVFRIHVNTHLGRHIYVDDLVTDAALRSRGIGHALMAWLRGTGQAQGCTTLALDSGVQRADAHRFYFREGLAITSFNFKQSLN
jgi:GNAT superfamily N-acetyltransferase